MYYVYILKSKKCGKNIYIGFTSNIKERFKQHNNKEVYSTKYGVPWELIYCEIYKSKKDANDRESKLKKYGSTLRHLKQRIKHSLV